MKKLLLLSMLFINAPLIALGEDQDTPSFYESLSEDSKSKLIQGGVLTTTGAGILAHSFKIKDNLDEKGERLLSIFQDENAATLERLRNTQIDVSIQNKILYQEAIQSILKMEGMKDSHKKLRIKELNNLITQIDISLSKSKPDLLEIEKLLKESSFSKSMPKKVLLPLYAIVGSTLFFMGMGRLGTAAFNEIKISDILDSDRNDNLDDVDTEKLFNVESGEIKTIDAL